MDKKFLTFLRSLPIIAQNLRINISLKGWPAAVAVWGFSGAVIGVAAIFASAKAEGNKGDKAQGKEEPPGESQQDNSDVPTKGSSDEEDDPSFLRANSLGLILFSLFKCINRVWCIIRC